MEIVEVPQLNNPVDFTTWLQEDCPLEAVVCVTTEVDMTQLLPVVNRAKEIHIDFISFNDGRGFSIVRKLRLAGFSGRLVAVGDVSVDRVAFMQRVGFDVVQLKAGQSAELAQHLLRQIQVYYQSSTDGRGLLHKPSAKGIDYDNKVEPTLSSELKEKLVSKERVMTNQSVRKRSTSPTDFCGLSG